jgi:DegV family protein with EDD domain
MGQRIATYRRTVDLSSHCQIASPGGLVERYRVEVVPLNIHSGRISYQERVDIDSAQFHRILAQAEELPTTSQPSPAKFREVYSRLIANGDQPISLRMSGQLSGTFQPAMPARGILPAADITVIDCPSVSMGRGADRASGC